MDSQRIRENGWCQGAIFREKDSTILSKQFGICLPEGDRLIVLSHDCDVVHSGDSEPNVEVGLVARLDGGVSGHKTYGKNPRFLHLEVDVGADHAAIEIGAALKYSIPRELLENYQPDCDLELDGDHVAQIRRWLANRYSRPALPDAFNSRISVISRNPVRNSLKLKAKYVSGVFIALKTWGELSDGEDYDLTVLATMEVGDYSIEARRVEAGEALAILANALKDSDGINVDDHMLLSEADVSIDDRRNFIRLNFDDLSLRERRDESIAPD